MLDAIIYCFSMIIPRSAFPFLSRLARIIFLTSFVRLLATVELICSADHEDLFLGKEPFYTYCPFFALAIDTEKVF
jgi:hypothetical protein